MGLPPFDEAVTGLPTSVQLREMQTAFEDTAEDLKHAMMALAASQADLTAMQQDRDGLRARNAELKQAYADAKNEARVMRRAAEQYLEQRDNALHDRDEARYALRTTLARLENVRAELDAANAERDKVLAENDLHGHQLADVTDYLQRSRTWQVARQDAGACVRCGEPIVRSQAVEPQPGTTKGSYSHVECPDVTT